MTQLTFSGALSSATLLLRMAGKQKCRLATAESCTGGRIAATFTAIPGSSENFMGGVVAYSNVIKESLLQVPLELLKKHGAVSEPVVRSMAEGSRRIMKADWTIATSGIAGPGGGSEEKPVGLVWFAASCPEETWSISRIFSGNREQIQSESVLYALEWTYSLLQNHFHF